MFLQNFMGVEGVAFWAHIGGFVAGLLLIRAFDGGPPISSRPSR